MKDLVKESRSLGGISSLPSPPHTLSCSLLPRCGEVGGFIGCIHSPSWSKYNGAANYALKSAIL